MAARSRVKSVIRIHQIKIAHQTQSQMQTQPRAITQCVWYSGGTSGDNQWDTSKKFKATSPRP